jgi:hypothetical protein
MTPERPPTCLTPTRLAMLVVACCVGRAGLNPAAAQQQDLPGADSGGVVGGVIDRHTQDPIRGAQVALTGTTLAMTTDSAGHFALTGLDSGLYVIDIRAVGYAPAAWHLVLKSRQVLRQLFQMDPLPVELPEVVVTGRQPLSARHFADFERRRHGGMGHFLTQEQIERSGAASLVDVLVTVRGVQQVCITNDCVAKMVRSPPGCYPQYFLDGNESSAYFARHTPPGDVKGVEIYRGASEAPGEFTGSNSGCGIIAIWTKSSP